MNAIDRIKRLFSPLDTTAVDTQFDALEASIKAKSVRARALRMDLCCGEPGVAIERMSGQVRAFAGQLLRDVFHHPLSEQVPPDMTALVDRIE